MRPLALALTCVVSLALSTSAFAQPADPTPAPYRSSPPPSAEPSGPSSGDPTGPAPALRDRPAVGMPTPAPEATPTQAPEAAPAPSQAPTPAPTQTPTPDPTLTHTLEPAPDHHDRRGRLELTATSEGLVFFSDSVGATTDNNTTFTPQLRVGFGLTEHLVLSLGWRNFVDMSRSDRAYDLTTSGDALLVTARYELPLTGALALAAELDLELTHLDFDLAVGQLSGSTDTWGFGALPKAVFITRADLDPVSLDFRVFVGLALRTSHHPDDLVLGSTATNVTALDLGALDLSGFIAGATLALGF